MHQTSTVWSSNRTTRQSGARAHPKRLLISHRRIVAVDVSATPRQKSCGVLSLSPGRVHVVHVRASLRCPGREDTDVIQGDVTAADRNNRTTDAHLERDRSNVRTTERCSRPWPHRCRTRDRMRWSSTTRAGSTARLRTSCLLTALSTPPVRRQAGLVLLPGRDVRSRPVEGGGWGSILGSARSYAFVRNDRGQRPSWVLPTNVDISSSVARTPSGC